MLDAADRRASAAGTLNSASVPAAGTAPTRAPLPWNPAEPYKGLGFRGVDADAKTAQYQITEFPVMKKA
jgi:hypothetical protein